MIGQKLGPYNIIEEIGKGGMATVFRAHQPSIDRDVAVKLIRTRIADDPTAIQRFQREARLIARLEHPHILPVYDFDGSHDPPYIVMRYLEGGTLKEVMAQGKLPLPEVTYLLRQVCSAMDYAHRQGIVHRDLKPSNILIDREGNAFVMDFGIARMAADMGGKQITETGAIVGTPDYMAPEQIQGSNTVDQRADVYSLGIIAYEMLSNDFPFPKVDAMAMMYHHMKEEPASICEKAPDLPDAVEDVIDLVLEKDPELRYSSAAEFAEELTKALGGTVSSSPVTLRAAAGTSIIKRVGGVKDSATDSHSTPSEQNKTVMALYADASEYGFIIEEQVSSEAARRALEALWNASERIVKEHEGQVFLRSDTELLILWGADAAHEDDAERCIRTALAIQDSLRELGAVVLSGDDEPLPLNIGINSGMALLVPQGETGSYSASGTTISIANRMMQNAYGTILITHEVFRQVMGVFDVEEDVPLRIRGRKEPIESYCVVGAKERAFHIQLRGIEGIETQMVGREAELKQLQKAYLYAIEDEETQVVTIISDAGIGKSRLLYEFGKWGELREETYRIFRGRATASMRDRPYALIRDMMSFRFDIYDSDSSDTVREKLEAGIMDILERDDGEMAHMIGQLCGFDLSESRHIKGLLGDPQQLTNRAKQLFIRFFIQLAGEISPVVMELEDIHYADDASLDLLNELFVEDDELPILVICNARPLLLERRPEWGSGQPFHSQIELKALDKRDSRDLARELLQKVEDLPKELRDLLVDRAEGNPFYMEELVKMLLDDRVILRDNENVWTVEESRLGSLNVPTTLNGLLEARLDTLLAPEKLTLQRASVVGRFFYDSALEMIDAADEHHVNQLQAILDTLVEREFIFRRETTNFEGSTEYIFASNMLRDAIEHALLERQIKTYNKAAGDWLVKIADTRVDEYLAHIAEYYENAGENELAAEYLIRSAEKALNIGAYIDAKDVLERALKLVPEDSQERVQSEIKLAEVLSLTASVSEAKEHAEFALQLARQLNDERLTADALQQLGEILSTMGEFSEALAMLEEALMLARKGHDRALVGQILQGIGHVYVRLNNDEAARSFAEEAIQIARDIEDSFLLMRALNGYGNSFITTATLESLEQGQAAFEEMIEIAKRIGNRDRQSGVLGNLAYIAYLRAELTGEQHYHEESLRYDEEAVRIRRETGNLSGQAVGLGNLAESYMNLGQFEKAYATIIEAIEVNKRLGATYWQLSLVSVIARLRVLEGKFDEGLEILGVYHYHPVAVEAGAEQTNQILPLLPDSLSEAEIEEKMLKGKDKDHMAILDAFLEENGG